MAGTSTIKIIALAALAGATFTDSVQSEPSWIRLQSGASSAKSEPLAGRMLAHAATAGAATESAPAVTDESPVITESGVAATTSDSGQHAAANPVEGGAATASHQGTIGLPGLDEGGRSQKVQINLGSEFEEKGSADVFKDQRFLQMLGTNPRFVYDATDLPDPMVFPPVRNDAMKNELWLKHDNLITESKVNLNDPLKGDFDKAKVHEAIESLRKIYVLNDPRYTEQVNRRVQELSVVLNSEPPKPEGIPGVVEAQAPLDLPEWVRSNIRGILASGSDPVCLVGDFMLRVGDPVPDYPNVVVTSINANGIAFKVSNETESQTHEVGMKPYEESGFFGAGAPEPGKRSSRRPGRQSKH